MYDYYLDSLLPRGFYHVGRMTQQQPQFNNRQWLAAHFGPVHVSGRSAVNER